MPKNQLGKRNSHIFELLHSLSYSLLQVCALPSTQTYGCFSSLQLTNRRGHGTTQLPSRTGAESDFLSITCHLPSQAGNSFSCSVKCHLCVRHGDIPVTLTLPSPAWRRVFFCSNSSNADMVLKLRLNLLLFLSLLCSVLVAIGSSCHKLPSWPCTCYQRNKQSNFILSLKYTIVYLFIYYSQMQIPIKVNV